MAYRLEEAAETLRILRTQYDAENEFKEAMKRAKSWT